MVACVLLEGICQLALLVQPEAELPVLSAPELEFQVNVLEDLLLRCAEDEALRIGVYCKQALLVNNKHAIGRL